MPIEKGGEIERKLQTNLVDVLEKGRQKVNDDFLTKFYSCFQDLKYRILTQE